MITEQFGQLMQVVPTTPLDASRSRWLVAMISYLSRSQLRKAVERASPDTSVHVRVIGHLVILAEWRVSAGGASYYHVLYTWSAAK